MSIRKWIWCWAWKPGASFCARPRLSPECRICSGAQSRELPSETVRFDYALEYGTNSLSTQRRHSEWPASIDCRRSAGHWWHGRSNCETGNLLGAEIAGLGFVVELDFLKGRDRLKGYNVMSLLHYSK